MAHIAAVILNVLVSCVSGPAPWQGGGADRPQSRGRHGAYCGGNPERACGGDISAGDLSVAGEALVQGNVLTEMFCWI